MSDKDTAFSDFMMHEECIHKLLQAIKTRIKSHAKHTSALGDLHDSNLRQIRDFQHELEILAGKIGLDADAILESDE